MESGSLFFWFYDQFGGTLRTSVDLTTHAGKTIAAVAVREVALDGGTAVMTKKYFNQFIHSQDG